MMGSKKKNFHTTHRNIILSNLQFMFIAFYVSMSIDEILATDSTLSGATSRALRAAWRRWSGIGRLWCTWAQTWSWWWWVWWSTWSWGRWWFRLAGQEGLMRIFLVDFLTTPTIRWKSLWKYWDLPFLHPVPWSNQHFHPSWEIEHLNNVKSWIFRERASFL